ncbi:MAG: polyketide cyclase, partial [Nocardioides sp.]
TWVERLDEGELRPGSRVRLKQPRQAARIWQVTELDAPRRFVWEATLGPARMVATHLIEPLGDRGAGARNTLRLELTGPTSAMVGRLLGRTFASVLATENAGFKRVAEGPAKGAA